MEKNSMTQLRPLLLWNILNRETDKTNSLTTQKLLSELAEQGVPCERRALERDLEALIQAGFPLRKQRGKSYTCYLEKHTFDDGEIGILLDCIQSATFLTEKQTWDLMERLAALGGGGPNKIRSRTDITMQNSVNKTLNPEVQSSVSVIAQALFEQKKISFHYFDLNENHERIYRTNNIGEKRLYQVYPQAKTINNGFYYMLAKSPRHNDISVYRIDRMADTQIVDIDETFTPSDPSDLERYKKHMFEMYGGEEISVTLRIRKKFVRTLFDFFSPDELRLLKKDAEYCTFTCYVIKSPMFIAWCCSYGENITVLSPDSLVKEMKEYIRTLSKMYPDP